MNRPNLVSETACPASIDTPLGRMPAEFEPHAGCFMGWPGNPKVWSRDMVQANISELAAGGGGIHCITQQWPA